jgi:hypothetical protein
MRTKHRAVETASRTGRWFLALIEHHYQCGDRPIPRGDHPRKRKRPSDETASRRAGRRFVALVKHHSHCSHRHRRHRPIPRDVHPRKRKQQSDDPRKLQFDDPPGLQFEDPHELHAHEDPLENQCRDPLELQRDRRPAFLHLHRSDLSTSRLYPQPVKSTT